MSQEGSIVASEDSLDGFLGQIPLKSSESAPTSTEMAGTSTETGNRNEGTSMEPQVSQHDNNENAVGENPNNLEESIEHDVFIEEYQKKVVSNKLDREEIGRLPLVTLLVLSTFIATKMNNLMSMAINRMNRETKETMATLSHNQLIIAHLIQSCVSNLMENSQPENPARTRISCINNDITPETLPAEVVVPFENLAKENIYIRKELARMEAKLSVEPSIRNQPSRDGLRGRNYHFYSAINCCSGTVLVRNLDGERRNNVMTRASSFPSIFSSWKSSVIVLDSVCTCKGASNNCPVKKAIAKLNEEFPETYPRFTERFLPRIRVKVDSKITEAKEAWDYVRKSMPSQAEALGETPKLITKWRSTREASSSFVFEVLPRVRNLVAGKYINNSNFKVMITDSVYIPICKRCQRIGHATAKCNAATSNPRSDQCMTCRNSEHHPLSFNCRYRDRLIRAKLSRIDYGPEFRNSVVLYQ